MKKKEKIMSFPKEMEEIKGVVKLGGHFYWNWKFPFRHYKKEEIRIFTKTGIYLVNS